MTWSQKLISVSVQLASGSGTNQPITWSPVSGVTGGLQTFSGLRASARIWNAGSPVNNTALVKIWGLTQAQMNQLATLGIAFNILPLNIITVMVGDGTAPLSTVFQGTIRSAYGDYEAQPDVPMTFAALSGIGASLGPAKPNGWKGTASVATMMQTIASALNLNFENNNVTNTLKGESVEGTLIDQANRIAADAGISWSISGGTLAIWPFGGSRTILSGTIPVISSSTGMIGYPAYTQQGIIVKTLFNPLIQFGGLINVQSTLPQATGNWAINKIDHALDSQVRNGQWMSTIFAYNPSFAKTVIAPSTGSAL